jgi:hypothetical protein
MSRQRTIASLDLPFRPYSLNVPIETLPGLTEVSDHEWVINTEPTPTPGFIASSIAHLQLSKRAADMIPTARFYEAPMLRFLDEDWSVLLTAVDGSLIEVYLWRTEEDPKAETLAGHAVQFLRTKLGEPTGQEVWRGEWDCVDGTVRVGVQRTHFWMEVMVLARSRVAADLERVEAPIEEPRLDAETLARNGQRFAEMGRKDEAIRSIERALRAGYPVERLEGNPALDELRQDEAFKELIRILKKYELI